jgi:type II secretory pathway pseudopilin PulG
MQNHQILNQAGRSMIEMLGVLTIIGLLSVIGIYGYNKAMKQVALNRQGQEVNDFFAGLTAYATKTGRSTFTTDSFVSGFEQLGYLPDLMQKSTTANTYLDYFGNQVVINGVSDTTIDVWWYFTTADQFVNLAQNLQRFSINIQTIDIIHGGYWYQGDRTCTSSTTRCVSSTTLSEWQVEGTRIPNDIVRIYFYRR